VQQRRGMRLGMRVVSPLTTTPARGASPSARTTGPVKRCALLVTTPQRRPRASSASRSAARRRRVAS
jgi:hypothetical protein